MRSAVRTVEKRCEMRMAVLQLAQAHRVPGGNATSRQAESLSGEFGARRVSRHRDLMGLRAFPFVRHQNRRRLAMNALVPILTLLLAIAFSAPAPKSQSACEKAGMKWDATASAPKVKCTPTFA